MVVPTHFDNHDLADNIILKNWAIFLAPEKYKFHALISFFPPRLSSNIGRLDVAENPAYLIIWNSMMMNMRKNTYFSLCMKIVEEFWNVFQRERETKQYKNKLHYYITHHYQYYDMNWNDARVILLTICDTNILLKNLVDALCIWSNFSSYYP